MDKILPVLIKYRLWIALGISGVILIFESVHHINEGHNLLYDLNFWIEFTSYGLIFPLLAFLFLGILDRQKGERDQAVKELTQEQQLDQKLAASQSWDELVETIVAFPAAILPVTRVYLHLYSQSDKRLTYAGVWRKSGLNLATITPLLLEDDCHCLEFTEGPNLVTPCYADHNRGVDEKYARYCLPLQVGTHRVGLVHLDLDADMTVPLAQMKKLSSVAPRMALALSNASYQAENENVESAMDRYRLQLAKDLHDNLGHDIALLRLKLEGLLEFGDLNNVTEIRAELERMRIVTELTYEHMRSALDAMQPTSQDEFEKLLLAQSQAVADRAGFQVVYSSCGSPVKMHPKVKQQILYICREVLNNIEKHARADQVTIQVSWETDQLGLSISDYGVGFDLEKDCGCPDAAHYGLAIMQERAETLGGELQITSQLGKGTRVSFCIPIIALGTPDSQIHYQINESPN